MERHFRDALEEEVVYDHSQFGLLNSSQGDDSYSSATLVNESPHKAVQAYRWSKLLRTAALCGAYVSLGMCMSVTGPTLPFLKDQVGSTMAEISWIFTARSAGTLGGSFVGGLVLDRFNPYSLFFLVVASMALGTGAMPWCKHLWMLMASSIMVGMANGFLDTGASTVCLQLWGKESGPYMQAMHFAFAVGGSIAPLLVQAFIGQTTVPNGTTLMSSSRHVRSVTEPIHLDGEFANETVALIMKSITQDPAALVNVTLSSTESTASANATTTTAVTTTTAATERPRKPKPEKTDGAKLGKSDQFDAIPIPQLPVAGSVENVVATTTGNATTTTTTATAQVTLSPTSSTVSENATIPDSSKLPSLEQNVTVAGNPTTGSSEGNTTIVTAGDTSVSQNVTTVMPTLPPQPVTSAAPTEVTSTTSSTTTIGTTTSTTQATTTVSTTTTTPEPPTTSATTAATTTTTTTTAAPPKSSTTEVTKSRGKYRGQQLEESIITTTSIPSVPSTTVGDVSSSPPPATTTANGSSETPKTYINYLELFGVTRMHLLYTVIAIIVLHTAFAFLFFLCSSTRNSAAALSTVASERNTTERNVKSFEPNFKLLFVFLLFLFYLFYVACEVIFAQFITTFALESQLHLSTTAANYVTTTYWVSFAAARFLAIFFAHFSNATVMLVFNLSVTTVGSLALCIAAQSSIYILYAGSALLGIGTASTFATGFVWTEQHLLVTSRISAAFSIASSMGEMIFPTVTGALMEKNAMSLMYMVLGTHLLCVFTFVAARFVAKSQARSSNRGYQLARQGEDEYSNQ